jgi:hypothetical protein
MVTVPVYMDYLVARRFHEGRWGILPKLPSYQQGLLWLGLAETRKDGQLPAKAEEWHAPPPLRGAQALPFLAVSGEAPSG